MQQVLEYIMKLNLKIFYTQLYYLVLNDVLSQG